MKKLQTLLDTYGESHLNPVNKLIHWICVPAIVYSLFGLFYSIPFFVPQTFFFNWATVVWVLVLFYYFRLSMAMFLGFIPIGLAMIYINHAIFLNAGSSGGTLALGSLAIFIAAWIGQFIGHKIEGKKPSFLQDLQYLLIGPAWLLHFIFQKLGVKY